MKILFYGSTGWIGQKLIKLLSQHEVIPGKARLENLSQLTKEFESIVPDHVISCAGLTGRPNVDWCEDHHLEVTQVNSTGTLALANLCLKYGINLTYMGTGCIFSYDSKHLCPELGISSVEQLNRSGIVGYTEADIPNFTGSFYSLGKGLTESLLKEYPNVLILRIRMPISDDLAPRSFVTKITKYAKVVNIPNSMSVLSDLLPLVPEMIQRDLTGIYNFTNPGVISHNQILEMYRELVDNSFTWTNFTLEEQAEVIRAERSNNYLDASKLHKEFPDLPEILPSMRKLLTQLGSK